MMTGHTKHGFRAAALGILLLVGVAGCERGGGPTAGQGVEAQGFRVVELDSEDAGATIALAQNDVLRVTLEGRPATGSSWYVASLDPATLRLGDTTLEAAPRLGGTDRQVFYFVGVAAGETELALDYGRPWERRPERRFRLHVAVAAPPTRPFVAARPARLSAAPNASLALPARYDVCASGGCTPVKDQLGCGSCWAFATNAVVESAIARKDGVVRDLSEQYLLSCNTLSYTCAGGWAEFDLFVNEVPAGEPSAGAVYEADDPYLATDAPCAAPHPHHEKLLQWEGVANDVDSLKQGLLDHGALWVTVCADGAFGAYRGGVFEGSNCPVLNHAVALVGWDDADGGYWILKNSWGAGWGEEGYMRIRYGANLVGGWAYSVDYAGGSGCQGGGCAAPEPEPCSGLCSSPTQFSGPNFSSGNFGTDARCWQTTAALHAGSCGNLASPRSLSVNGTTMPCTGANWTLPAPRHGGYCVQASAGDFPWAWFVVW